MLGAKSNSSANSNRNTTSPPAAGVAEEVSRTTKRTNGQDGAQQNKPRVRTKVSYSHDAQEIIIAVPRICLEEP